MGSPDEPGVNMRALNELFRLKNMKAKSIKILVELSFLEIYCDEINDLLVPIDKRTKCASLAATGLPQLTSCARASRLR